MSELQIRLVRATELDRLVQLCGEHAKHEGISFDATVKASALAELFFSDDPRICCLVVEADQQLVGYASYAIQYSTWQAAQYLYLDCLYLTPKFRGLGLGKELMNKVRTFANECGCAEVQWQTPSDNRLAIGFYDSIAGTRRASKFRYKLSQHRFANTQ